MSTVGGGDSDGGSNGDGIERDSVGESETAMPPLENHAPSTDDRNWEFVDLWTHTHNLSSHSESGVAGTESDISRNHDDDLGLTFPACNPIKRIDYLFLHRASAERDWGDRMDSEVQVEVIGTHIAGVRPTADTGTSLCVSACMGMWMRECAHILCGCTCSHLCKANMKKQ